MTCPNSTVNVFLSSLSCSSKYIEPEEQSLEPLICSWLVRSTGNDLFFRLLFQGVGGTVLWDWALACGIWHYLWVHSVRTEFNCRISTWFLRLACCGKSHTHLVTISVRSVQCKCSSHIKVRETYRKERYRRWKTVFSFYFVSMKIISSQYWRQAVEQNTFPLDLWEMLFKKMLQYHQNPFKEKYSFS